MAFYAHNLINTPNTLDCEGKQFNPKIPDFDLLWLL
jgi:hypothetical protein